jgi:hypothetical protein
MHGTHADEAAPALPRASTRRRKGRLGKWGWIAAASTVAAASPCAGASPALAAAHAQPTTYRFETLDNAKDLTFNQLLAINNRGMMAGYFGSGTQDHPNQGYLLFARDYVDRTCPGRSRLRSPA